MRLFPVLTGVLFPVIWQGQAVSAPEPVFREDLREFFQQSICAEGHEPATQDLWKKRIWDAGLHLRVLTAKTTGKLHPDKIRVLARSQAVRGGGLSYSYGICQEESRKAWILSSPAPGPLKGEAKAYRLPAKELLRHCGEWSLDFAPAGHGFSRKIAGSGEASLKDLVRVPSAGALSLSCRPEKPDRAGPSLWYLVPEPVELKAQMPELAQDAQEENTQTLKSWINQVRTLHGLTPLHFGHTALEESARVLAMNPSVQHDRRQLEMLSDELKRSGFSGVGENRVMTKSIQEARQLFWISPRHRSLILSKSSSDAGMFRDQESGLLVLVVSRKTPGPIAKQDNPDLKTR